MRESEFKNHISTQYDKELEALRTEFLAMGGLIEKQFADAIHSLLDTDIHMAEDVIFKDKMVNDLERSLDESIARVLAKRQPAAKDLRLILMLSKSITDLERIGDESVKIARIAKAMMEEGDSPRGYRETRNISNQVRLMIHEVLDAFARFNAEQALRVMQADVDIDYEYQTAMRALLTYLMEDGRYISRIINVMWVLRAVERVGDHARNVAEQVIYVISGNDVRHLEVEDLEKNMIEEGHIDNHS